MAKELNKMNKKENARPERVKVSAEEALKRMQEFAKRKHHFIAAVRKGKD